MRMLSFLMIGVGGSCGYFVWVIIKGMPRYEEHIYKDFVADKLYIYASDLLTLSTILAVSLMFSGGLVFVIAAKPRTYKDPMGSGVMEMIVEEPPPPPLPPPNYPKEKYGE